MLMAFGGAVQAHDGVEFGGEVVDRSEAGFTVATDGGDRGVTVDGDTRYKYESGEQATYDDVEVGGHVYVYGEESGDSVLASKVVLKGSDPDQPFKFKGKVTALEEGAMTVENEEKVLTFVLTGDTEVYLFDEGRGSFPTAHEGDHGSLDDLAVGQKVLVVAVETGEDTYTALKIGIFAGGEKIRIVGELTFVGEDSVTVVTKDKEFHLLVTPDTVITLNPDDKHGVAAHDHEDDKEPGTLDDLEVGMRVLVFAHEDGDNLVADRIHVLGVKEPEGIKIFGTIAEIGEGVIKLDTGDKVLDILVNEDTKVIFKGNYNDDDEEDSDDDGATAHDIHRASLDDLEVGMRIVVFAFKDGDTLVAKAIVAIGDEDKFDDHLFRGIIREVGEGAIVLKTRKHSIEIQLNSNTEVSHQNGDDATFADLKVGLLVAVSAEKGDGGIWANKIIILDGVDKPERGQFELEGVVISKDAGAGTFDIRQPRGSEVTIYTDGDTDFVNADGSLATFDSIAEGLFVAVEGKPQDDGLLAGEVQLYNEVHEAGVVGRATGPTKAVSAGGTFVLKTGQGRKLVTVSKRTIVRFQDGRRGSLANVKKGTPILVEATGKGAKLKASKITILRNRGAIVRTTAKVVKARAGGLSVKIGRRTLSFQATPGTVVLLETGQAIGLGKLKAGQRVLLVGYRAAGERFVTMVHVTR